VSAFLKTWL